MPYNTHKKNISFLKKRTYIFAPYNVTYCHNHNFDPNLLKTERF